MSLTEKRARNCASESEFELVKLITRIVDEILKNRRMRPVPVQAGMSKRQFATSVGVGVSTVEKEIGEGRLEALKVRERTIITPGERERWLANCPRINPKRRNLTDAAEERSCQDDATTVRPNRSASAAAHAHAAHV